MYEIHSTKVFKDFKLNNDFIMKELLSVIEAVHTLVVNMTLQCTTVVMG